MTSTPEPNPYESSASLCQVDSPKIKLTLRQQMEGINSVKRRLKEGESRAEIYKDFQNTSLEKNVCRILHSTPPKHRCANFRWINLLLLVTFVAFSMLTSLDLYQAGHSAISIGIVILLHSMAIYWGTKFHRTSYFMIAIWTGLFLFLSLPHALSEGFEESELLPLILTALSGGLAFGLTIYLLVQLFPLSKPFIRMARTPDGAPAFDE